MINSAIAFLSSIVLLIVDANLDLPCFFSVRYDKKTMFLILQTLAATKQDKLSGGDIDDHRIPDDGTPGWVVVNLKSGIYWKKFGINLAFNNIFNEAYRVHGSGIDGLGRHLAGSIRYNF